MTNLVKRCTKMYSKQERRAKYKFSLLFLLQKLFVYSPPQLFAVPLGTPLTRHGGERKINFPWCFSGDDYFFTRLHSCLQYLWVRLCCHDHYLVVLHQAQPEYQHTFCIQYIQFVTQESLIFIQWKEAHFCLYLSFSKRSFKRLQSFAWSRINMSTTSI